METIDSAVQGELNRNDGVKPKQRAKTKKRPAKKAKARKAPKRKTAKKVKTKKRPAKKAKARKAPKRKIAKKTKGGVERSERLDMRLTKAEKAKVVAKAKKTRRTVTSLVIEAIEKIR